MMVEQVNSPDGAPAALVASPNTAMRMLDCSRESLYRLIKSEQLESYCEGRSRKIIVASIHAHIERRLAAAAPSAQLRWCASCPRAIGSPIDVRP
jgi:hypothetical protein